MAITWELEITPLEVEKKTAYITAVRIDSEDSDNPKTYIVHRANLSTQAQQLVALNEVWAKHQAQLAFDEQIQDFLDKLEEIGKANLEARE